MSKLNPSILSKDEIIDYGLIGEVEGMSPVIAQRIVGNHLGALIAQAAEDREEKANADSIQE